MVRRAEPSIEWSVRELLARRERLVLAVSGGADSSVLLHAAGTLRTPSHRIVVATVDHGTGPAATEAVAQVVLDAARLGLAAITERLRGIRHTEALWREARWAFLRDVARREHAVIVTAHTRGDQVETVAMRILRGSGARGLAGLLAPSDVERPLLFCSRAAIADYARRHGVSCVDDPSNTSRAFLRNRLRLDVLPALEAARPGFGDELFALSERAAALRRKVDEVAAQLVSRSRPDALASLDTRTLATLDAGGLKLVLPAALEIAGVWLDRRGLELLAGLVAAGPGTRGQLAGGFEAIRARDELLIVRRRERHAEPMRLNAAGETVFPGFRFRAVPVAAVNGATAAGTWTVQFPSSMQLVVRQWYPGDRLTNDVTGGQRRIARYFADAGIVGPLREHWPVVARGKDVVWIPGVRATPLPPHPGEPMIEYRCERVRE